MDVYNYFQAKIREEIPNVDQEFYNDAINILKESRVNGKKN